MKHLFLKGLLVIIVLITTGCSSETSPNTTLTTDLNNQRSAQPPITTTTVPTISTTQPSTEITLPPAPTAVKTVIPDNELLPGVAKVLDPAPSTCPAGWAIPKKELKPGFSQALGGSPVWAIGFTGVNAQLHIMGEPQFILTKYGWGLKVLLLVESSYAKAVNLKGKNLADNTHIWFVIGSEDPSTTPMLEPGKENIFPQHKEWKEYPSNWFIPKAGCYSLEASWAEGGWNLIFATGR